MGGDFRAVEVAHAVEQVVGRRQAVDVGVVRAQDEFHAHVGQRLQQEGLPDMGEFGLGGTQELAAGGHVEEQVAHGDIRAARRAGVAHVLDLAAEDQDFRAGGGAFPVGDEGKLRDGGDGREGLAPEAQRGDRIEILELAQLAGGVAFDGQQRVVAVHARSVVADAHEPAAAVDHFDLDARGAGVHGVLDQFLEDGRGALDDLPRGDLVDHRVGQDANGGWRGHGRRF